MLPQTLAANAYTPCSGKSRMMLSCCCKLHAASWNFIHVRPISDAVLELYPRADRSLTPFRLLLRVLMLNYQVMTDVLTTRSRCKACTVRLTRSNGSSRAATINSFGCEEDDCTRAYHRSDLREKRVSQVAGRRQGYWGEWAGSPRG